MFPWPLWDVEAALSYIKTIKNIFEFHEEHFSEQLVKHIFSHCVEHFNNKKQPNNNK